MRGFSDPNAITLPDGKPVWYQPDPLNPDGYVLPFHMDTMATSAAAVDDLSHAWAVQHASWNGGKMDNWVPAHRASNGNTDGPLTMAYYTRADLPFHYALADAFTICDACHCSVMAPTNPNRLYGWTGTIDPGGKNGGPVIDNSETPPYTWTTYPERLQAAGISWKNYQEPDTGDDNPLAWFAQYQKAPPSSPLYRYGMATALVISPFSTGGRIYREVADYTSTIRFMERLFGVEEPNISAWRRKTCSDFTGALNLRPDRRGSFPGLPPTRDYLLRQYITSQDQSPPTVPAVQSLPTQEH